jgi:dienelactone hydrolase
MPGSSWPQGYAVAVPHFLAAYGISPKQRRRTWSAFREKLFADFSRIAAEVSGKLAIDRGRVFAVGFSNGGYWAAYLAGKGVVRKGVAYYAAVTEAGNNREVDNLGSALPGQQRGAVLFLHGTGDKTVNVGAVRRLQKRVGPAAGFVYYEGAGHRFERESTSANDAAAADAWKRTLNFLAR